MKKQYLYIAVVALIVVAGAIWYLVAHKPAATATSNMSSMNTNNNSAANTSGEAPVSTNNVTIHNFAFSPAAITVKVGTVVTWTNQDSIAHTVTETDGLSGPASGNVNPGSSFSFTFRAPGTYHYHCSIHPEMTGTVTVAS